VLLAAFSTNRFVCQQQRSEIMQCFVCFVNFSFLLRRVFRGSCYTRQLLHFVVVFAGPRRQGPNYNKAERTLQEPSLDACAQGNVLATLDAFARRLPGTQQKNTPARLPFVR